MTIPVTQVIRTMPAKVLVTNAGMFFLSAVNNLLVEDCKFSFYTGNAIEGAGSGNVILRRNVIVDNWNRHCWPL